MAMHVKKDDRVVVISGKDRGKKGKVMIAQPTKGRVIVEKVNMLTKHTRPRKQGETGGIIHQEGPINASNVMLVCNKCGKATRIAYKILKNGSKVRVCKKCGETFDK
ncbi:MAG: 50S ribosomal protein L24 [Eubacteriales bacterium]